MQKVDLLKEYGLYINGEFVPASDGTTFAAHNPANGEALALCAEATKQDVDRAVKAAREALPSWSKTSPIERQNLLSLRLRTSSMRIRNGWPLWRPSTTANPSVRPWPLIFL